jgi:benzoyl-CoA reductase/2-hydroxyglutaryl-CoA dehydratase subunit BcrC/BadD/HgdB
MAGEGKYSFLDGAIICNGCDTMRRLDDCWRKMGEDIQGALPPYLFHYAAPHKVTDYSLKWFVDETRRFIASLEERFGCRITEDGLRKAIRIYNRGRELLGRLDELRMGERVLISGTEAMAVMIAGTAMPPDVFNELLEEVLAEVECRQEGIPGKRLLLAGSVIDDLDLLRVIEEEGAVVVADTLCFGSRSHKDAVAEDGDPVEAIARRYLDAIYCPRMFGYYKQRFAFLREMAERAGVEGVILQNIRFCDLHGSENGIFERDLEAAGIPCMKMEREYGPLGEEGRIKMRIDAFLERISERKEQP